MLFGPSATEVGYASAETGLALAPASAREIGLFAKIRLRSLRRFRRVSAQRRGNMGALDIVLCRAHGGIYFGERVRKVRAGRCALT